MGLDHDAPLLSVVVKCLNEEVNLERCLRALAAELSGQPYASEIILADSKSSDRSVEIAQGFDVTIVQLAQAADRSCGAAGCLGWQFVRGDFVFQLDGDHELVPGFLGQAFAAMRGDGQLGAVGGRVVEMSDGLEYRERQLRSECKPVSGLVGYVPSCGLYRTAAIRQAGYFTDRNLHSNEEFELGLRLRAHGWRLLILETPSVKHYGHRDASVALLARRWRTRFMQGHGEVLRAAWGKSYFSEAVWYCRLSFMTIAWWCVLVGFGLSPLVLPSADSRMVVAMLLGLAVLPFAILLSRKGSVNRAVYALLALQFSAAGLIAGVFARRVDAAMPLEAVVLRDPRRPIPFSSTQPAPAPTRAAAVLPADRLTG